MSPLDVVATFLASGVEWVEAFTIVLAVGLFGGWRPALTGTGLAAVALGAIVVAAGTAVNSFPVAAAQIVVGVFLLLFGLRWLHKARGRVVSRAEILEQVFGQRGDLQTRAVDMAIVVLRKKVEHDPAHPRIIVSVKGAGYAWGPATS